MSVIFFRLKRVEWVMNWVVIHLTKYIIVLDIPDETPKETLSINSNNINNTEVYFR